MEFSVNPMDFMRLDSVDAVKTVTYNNVAEFGHTKEAAAGEY